MPGEVYLLDIEFNLWNEKILVNNSFQLNTFNVNLGAVQKKDTNRKVILEIVIVNEA